MPQFKGEIKHIEIDNAKRDLKNTHTHRRKKQNRKIIWTAKNKRKTKTKSKNTHLNNWPGNYTPPPPPIIKGENENKTSASE